MVEEWNRGRMEWWDDGMVEWGGDFQYSIFNKEYSMSNERL
jgi:hypothetical protein